MKLLRLSGHSGAGKTRLVNALPQSGISCHKVIRYTSRAPRPEEAEGDDYFFRSRQYIASLPEDRFFVGPVRNMLQAFDLNRIEMDLKMHDLVLIEIYPDLWPRLLERMYQRLGNQLATASVFLTAVDPERIMALPDEKARSEYISQEVEKIIMIRNKDSAGDISIRADAAAREILEALSPEGKKMYTKIIHSAAEGPDGEDDWTRDKFPVGLAKSALEEFKELFLSLRSRE